MARQKSITIDELKNFLNEYRIANPYTKVEIPKLGIFIRSFGVDVKDYTIRRNTEFRKLLDEINQNFNKETYSDVVTYNTLNPKAFIQRNNTPEKLIAALTNRDTYYRHVADKAAQLFELNKTLQQELVQKNDVIKDLASKLAEAKSNKTSIKEKDNAIKTLKNIIDIYVYPSAANALLAKEGILEVVAGVVDDDTIDNLTITANTNINDFTSDKTRSFVKSTEISTGHPAGFAGELPAKLPANEENNKPFKYDSVNNLLGDFD